MLDKLFSWGKKKDNPLPDIQFGHYSDNNKSVEKTARWSEADKLFKERKYHESINVFFDYLRDDAADNVQISGQGTDFKFEISQGSKIARGWGDADQVQAEVSLARMPQPSVAVMRRLLEQNFSLNYSRNALDGDRLCMRFNSDIETANPNKLYYGLKELATRADKQDDLLVKDFAVLEPLDLDHIIPIPEAEKEIKFNFFQKWIKETIDYCNGLDAEKFSGGIAYLYLGLAYRIDFLICPDGGLLSELEKIPAIYFDKDEKPVTEKNKAMQEGYRNLLEKPKEEMVKHLFRSKSTFAILAPQQYKVITDAIYNANNNMTWYRDNDYHLIGQQICEYGISYCQYSYSLPRPLTEFYQLFMQVNYPDYFNALGYTQVLYELSSKTFSADPITEKIRTIQASWKLKYPKLDFKTANLRFDSLLNFNHTFTTELEYLNFDTQ